MNPSVINALIVVLMVGSSASCGGSGDRLIVVDENIHFSLGGPQMVTKGNTVYFSVVVENEPGNDKVNWFCSKGSITDHGAYTAPISGGPVEIAATRKDNGSRRSMSVGLMDPPEIIFFRADPAEITLNGHSTLTFQGYPNSGTVTPGGMLINSFTPVVVSPVTTSTYKVTVYNSDAASATAEVTVTVK